MVPMEPTLRVAIASLLALLPTAVFLFRRNDTLADRHFKIKSIQSKSSQSLPPFCIGKGNISGALPNILLIGAQKAGTTSVSDWLYRYGVCFANDERKGWYKKELHFYDNHYKEGVDVYTRQFAHCCSVSDGNRGTIGAMSFTAMDATPSMMMNASRVRSTYDSVHPELYHELKIISILREPLSRDLSWYNHFTHMCRLHMANSHGINVTWQHKKWLERLCFIDFEHNQTIMSFSEYVTDHVMPKMIHKKNTGMYADKMRTWMELFDREQILILSYDELVNNQTSFERRISSFLNLDPREDPGGMEKTNMHDNKQKIETMDCLTKSQLDAIYGSANKELYKLLEENPGPVMEQKPFPRFVPPQCKES